MARNVIPYSISADQIIDPLSQNQPKPTSPFSPAPAPSLNKSNGHPSASLTQNVIPIFFFLGTYCTTPLFHQQPKSKTKDLQHIRVIFILIIIHKLKQTSCAVKSKSKAKATSWIPTPPNSMRMRTRPRFLHVRTDKHSPDSKTCAKEDIVREASWN
jgi:hypothetical protein